MDLNYKTNLIFPTPIHQFDVNGFSEIKDELIDYAYDYKKKDPKGVSLSNRGGWQSEGFEIINEDDVLQLFLINCLSNFPPIKESVELRGYAWININKPGDYNINHVHPTNHLSGVLWIKTPKIVVILYLIHHMSFKHIKKLNHIVMSLKILLILTIIIILIQLKEE